MQVRIVVHSSLHSQSATLSDFLQNAPDPPLPLNLRSFPPESVWKREREALLKHISDECDSRKSNTSEELNGMLLMAATDLSNPDVCATSIVSSHLIRTVSQLVTMMVSGSGEPSLLWANPAALTSMRVVAFSSLLQLLTIVAADLSKNGLTQLDGKHKWNTTTLGYIISLVLDDFRHFSEEASEPFDLEDWLSKSSSGTLVNRESKQGSESKLERRSSKPRRGKHVRSDSDNNILIGSSSRTIPFLSSADDLDPLRQRSMTLPSNLSESLTAWKAEDKAARELEPCSTAAAEDDRQVPDRADSKADFQSALIAGSAGSFSDDLPPFASSPGSSLSTDISSSRRKFMTLPPTALATIREDSDADDIVDPQVPNASVRPDRKSALDTELVLHSGKKAPVKQMRVPRVKKAQLLDSGHTDEVPSNSPPVATSDEAIESAGTAFLDVVGKNLGYG